MPIILSTPNVTQFYIGTPYATTYFVYSNLNAGSLTVPLIVVDGTAVLNGTLILQITIDPSAALHDADILDLIHYRSHVGEFDRVEVRVADAQERCETYGGRVSYTADKAFMVMTVDNAQCTSLAMERRKEHFPLMVYYMIGY